MTSNGLEALIIVALGANLPGELNRPRQNLEKALVEMRTEHIHPVERSHWWRSAAWPDPSQPDYINGVALVETTLSPRDVLAALHRIEARLGRVRLGANAARTLDLDLIAYGREVISEPDLELPHPRAAQRLFVMGPLAQLAPDWTHPVSGMTAHSLASCATVGRDARPLSLDPPTWG